MENIQATGNPNIKKLMLFLTGGLLGAAVGYGVVVVATRLHLSPKSFDWFDFLALWLGVVFIALGTAVFFISTSRRRLARALEGDDARLPATNDEVRSFRLQSVTLGLAGVMLLIPTLTAASAATNPGSSPRTTGIAFAAVVLLFALQTIANIHLWRGCDEFARSLMLTTAALTFAVGQGLLFLYAAAERLHLVRGVSSWDVVTLLLALYVLVGAPVAMRNQR